MLYAAGFWASTCFEPTARKPCRGYRATTETQFKLDR